MLAHRRLHEFMSTVCCSDSPNAAEAHSEDYCQGNGASPKFNDAKATDVRRVMCEREISTALCPPGWTYYKDAGSEGKDSCLYVSASTLSNWNTASTSCSPGSHLLTVVSSGTTGGILPFATALFSSGVFVGCSQSSTATQRAMGWSWVDGTSANNLNCGAGGNGCGIWNTGEPK